MASTNTTINVIKLSALPSLGAAFEGGNFAGVTTRADGTHCAVVCLPTPGKKMTWQEASTWAAEQGGELPTRTVSAMLHASMKSAFDPYGIWTSETYSRTEMWIFAMLYGQLKYAARTDKVSVAAVRLIPLAE